MGFDLAADPVSAASPPRAWAGLLEARFENRAGRTIMARSHHHGPLRIQKLLYPEGPARADVLLLHPPSGIASGDDLRMQFELMTGSACRFTTPGAGKWYRACGPRARQTIRLRVQAGATLEWLPQEAIVFDGARAQAETRIDCAAGARACGWDIWMLGRRRSGEAFIRGELRLQSRLYRDGELLWSERACLQAGDPILHATQGWNGHPVAGTWWALGLPADESLLDATRAVREEGVHLGVTRFEHGLWLARALGHSAERVRAALTRIWQLTRPALCGADGIPPRIWAT